MALTRFERLLAALTALAALSGCGGGDNEPGRVWVISVTGGPGGDPGGLNAEGVLLTILRLRIPIYDTSCATTPIDITSSFNSLIIHRYLVSELEAPGLLASGVLREREPFEQGRQIFENPLCGWR
jgi:hypothetical protein